MPEYIVQYKLFDMAWQTTKECKTEEEAIAWAKMGAKNAPSRRWQAVQCTTIWSNYEEYKG